MNSLNESGHARLVTGFQTIIERCQEIGAAYNPSSVRIQIPSMTGSLADAQAALTTVNNARTNLNFVSNAREIAFKNLRKLVTRIINSLEAGGAAQQTIDDARYLLAKINGKRQSGKAKSVVVAPEDASTTETSSRSVSQTGYDAQVDHFNRLVMITSMESTYAPNEVDLQTTALQALVTDLQEANKTVINAQGALHMARLQRNAVFYGSLTGLVDLARQTKKYIKSIFGAASPQYKMVSSISVR